MQQRLPHCVCLAVACVAGFHPLTQAQLAAPDEMPVAQAVLQCPPPVVPFEQVADSKIVIADLTFAGSVGMAVSDLNQIAASIQQRRYSGDVDGVVSGLEERIRRAWQEHGYFRVQVRGSSTILTSSPLESRIAVAFQVDEGHQYRLSGITFKNNRAISSQQFLRSLFAIKDGGLFNAAQVSKGLEKLRAAYGGFGYINFTPVPDTRINEESQTISLDVDLDEGKQFYVSSIDAIGLDEQSSEDVIKNLLLKPGDPYNQRLLDLSTKHLSTPQSLVLAELHQDDAAGTVAITITIRDCSAK